MNQTAGPRIDKALARVLAGISISLAVIVGLALVLALLANLLGFDWFGAWFVVRSILWVGLFVLGFRYFRAQAP